MMDQNRVQLALSALKTKVGAPTADLAEQKKAALKADNKSDFSTHMKEKLAASDKKALEKNERGNASAKKMPAEKEKAQANASGQTAQEAVQVTPLDEAVCAQLAAENESENESETEQVNQEDSAQLANILPVNEAPLAKELQADFSAETAALSTELAGNADLSGNNMPLAVPLESVAIPLNVESNDDELSAFSDEELLLVTQQIGMAGALSPEQKLSPAELAGQAVGAKNAAETQINAALPALQGLLLAQSAPDGEAEPVEILELESLPTLDLLGEASKPQDFASSLRAVLGTQPASPLANMQVAQVNAPLHFDPQQQAQAAEELSERINLMLSKNLKQVDIRLDPPELGRLQIKLSMNNDTASVQFTVNNQAAKEMLEHALPRLREMLQQQGLQLAQSSVQQESHQQQSQFSGNLGHQQQGSAHLSAEGQVESDADAASASHHLSISKPADGIDYYA
ncbi:MAG: flagellar hook-length control protein FliK [Vibrionaceae bacterium]